MSKAADFICSNISVDPQSHLTFAGFDTLSLAEQFGTPLYLMDEELIRQRAREYAAAIRENFREGSHAMYASKANSFMYIYKLIAAEGLAADVVSPGEIHTALKAGFDAAQLYFQGNNKTDADIRYAMDNGVGHFVCDSMEELFAIEAEAAARGLAQKVLLRITPGIDPHTYAAVATGKVDSKFGMAIETGQAEEFAAAALAQPHIELEGFQCHVGSMVFAEDVYERTVDAMLRFILDIKNKYGYTAEYLDIGGGFGVRYVGTDGHIDIPAKIAEIAGEVHRLCSELGLEEPKILMEPGRSIVADAGMTLYHVGTVKNIPGYKTYVSVDGGMGDNPRYALYGSAYTCLAAGKMDEDHDMECSVVGRYCESGDILQEGVRLPQSIARGDVLAVCTTGAYNYSMASNYNRYPRPPIVMLRKDGPVVAVRRETLEDLTICDENI